MYINKLYLLTQRMIYSGYIDENTYYNYYTLNNTRVNSRNAYLGALVYSLLTDLFQGLCYGCDYMPNKLGISSRSLPNKLGICIIELGINRGHAFPDQAQRAQGKPTVCSLQFPTLLRSLLLSLALYRRNRGSLTATPSPCSCARNSLTMSYNPELQQSLLTKAQDELKNSLEFKTIKDKLENLSKDNLIIKNQ